MLGQRLKLARSAAGLSLRGLEERIENRVTAQAIGKYERDESVPSSGVLIALADALCPRGLLGRGPRNGAGGRRVSQGVSRVSAK